MSPYLSPDQLAHALSIQDLTDPSGGPHALQLVVDHAVNALAQQWGCKVYWWRGERIVTVSDNYDNLGYHLDDVTRDTRYTRYVDAQRMLRSHSSAMIPEALRTMASADDVLLVCPGIVYRRDTIDRQHTGTPHQLDLWRITRQASMTVDDLDEMIAVILDALLPGAEHRHHDRVHPYTVHGRQLDVHRGDEWIEVAECGVANPHVLQRAGLNNASGLALGMGLDRILMLIKNIPDIRILRSSHPAVATQLTDLNTYRQVSTMPSIRRDLSVAVNHDDLAEDLGDRVRESLGPDADCIETIEILTETPCSQLPPQALLRLGANTDHKNVLLRIVLRHLNRTLTDHEANLLRDRIYGAIHQGSTYEWTTPH